MLYSRHWIEAKKWMDGLGELDFLKESCAQIYQCASSGLPLHSTRQWWMFLAEPAVALKWMASPWFLDLTRSEVKKNELAVMSRQIFSQRVPVFIPKTSKVFVKQSIPNNCTNDMEFLLKVRKARKRSTLGIINEIKWICEHLNAQWHLNFHFNVYIL